MAYGSNAQRSNNQGQGRGVAAAPRQAAAAVAQGGEDDNLVGFGYNNESKNGYKYVGLSITKDIPANARLSLMPVKQKKTDTSPDFTLLVSIRKEAAG